MGPRILFDLERIDPEHVQISLEEIRKLNPQRHEFEQLDGVLFLSREEGVAVGFKDVKSDEFWARGHLPGKPILPGVLMIEAAAQLCSVYQSLVHPTDGFFGFGGVDDVKFREAVLPGCRLTLVARGVHVHPRRSVFEVQGFVEGRLVFEGTIIGVAIRKKELLPER